MIGSLTLNIKDYKLVYFDLCSLLCRSLSFSLSISFEISLSLSRSLNLSLSLSLYLVRRMFSTAVRLEWD